MSFIYDMADTWNAGGTTFTAIKMNVTDTASAAASLLMDLQVGGIKKFEVSKIGSLNIYNLFTDAANYERLGIRWTANELFFGTERAGAGAGRSLFIQSSGILNFQINGANDVWSMVATGAFVAAVDNTFDIGAAGATRPRTIHVGTSVISPTLQTPDLTVAALPAAAAGNKGQRRHVTDAAAPAFLAIVAGGGAVVTPVFSNGANWICG